MIRKTIITGVLFSYLLTININVAFWAEYKLNLSYIVINLCVQKDIEDNTCQGKCHLETNLEKNEQKNNQGNLILPEFSLTLHIPTVLLLKNYLNTTYNQFGYTLIHQILSRSILPEKPPPKRFPFFNII